MHALKCVRPTPAVYPIRSPYSKLEIGRQIGIIFKEPILQEALLNSLSILIRAMSS